MCLIKECNEPMADGYLFCVEHVAKYVHIIKGATMGNEPMLTVRQRAKVASEIQHLVGPMTTDHDASVIRFVAAQVGRQTEEEARFCEHDVRGRP